MYIGCDICTHIVFKNLFSSEFPSISSKLGVVRSLVPMVTSCLKKRKTIKEEEKNQRKRKMRRINKKAGERSRKRKSKKEDKTEGAVMEEDQVEEEEDTKLSMNNYVLESIYILYYSKKNLISMTSNDILLYLYISALFNGCQRSFLLQ